MSNFMFTGDSWALKGFTEDNHQEVHIIPNPGDTNLADVWDIPYDYAFVPSHGNLTALDLIKSKNIDSDMPIVWVYTEPGRDYGRITGHADHAWIASENIFEIRKELDSTILTTIRNSIKNPIGLIGGLSDFNVELAKQLGFEILHPSWQKWIATKLNSQWFKFGWGACDIGWRAHYNNIVPSKAATFAWDEQIKEWCWWEEEGYFCHEHPTPKAVKEFAVDLKESVEKFVNGSK